MGVKSRKWKIADDRCWAADHEEGEPVEAASRVAGPFLDGTQQGLLSPLPCVVESRGQDCWTSREICTSSDDSPVALAYLGHQTYREKTLGASQTKGRERARESVG